MKAETDVSTQAYQLELTKSASHIKSLEKELQKANATLEDINETSKKYKEKGKQ